MRFALGACSFPPRTFAKRFAAQVCGTPIAKVSDAEWYTIILLAKRFSRQMLVGTVPSDKEVAFAQGELDKRANARKAELEAKREAKRAAAPTEGERA